MTTIKNLLQNIDLLKKTSLSPRLDAEILLSLAIKKPKEFLYTYPDYKLNKKELSKFNQLINRRLKHEPIAYILGKKEFYGLDFLVNKNTLIPRPETEIMVDEVIKNLSTLRLCSGQALTFNLLTLIDIGTGSGCIPISIVNSGVRPLAKGSDPFPITTFALDISTKALKIAKINAKLHQVDKQIQFHQSDLLSYFLKNKTKLNLLNNQHIIITANLPYIPTKQYRTLSKDIKNFEPKQALIAGADGLKYYKQLFKQIKRLYKTINILSSTLLIEIEPQQDILIKKILKKDFDDIKIETIKDLSGLKRFVSIKFY